MPLIVAGLAMILTRKSRLDVRFFRICQLCVEFSHSS
jgi:hypothetical protein